MGCHEELPPSSLHNKTCLWQRRQLIVKAGLPSSSPPIQSPFVSSPPSHKHNPTSPPPNILLPPISSPAPIPPPPAPSSSVCIVSSSASMPSHALARSPSPSPPPPPPPPPWLLPSSSPSSSSTSPSSSSSSSSLSSSSYPSLLLSPLSSLSCAWQSTSVFSPTGNLESTAWADLSPPTSPRLAQTMLASSTCYDSTSHVYDCASLATSPTASPPRPPSYSLSLSPMQSSSSKEGVDHKHSTSFTFSIPERNLSPNCSSRLSHADELFLNGKLLPLSASSASSISVYQELPVLEKLQVHDPRMVAHPYIVALKPISSTSHLSPPKVFHIEEKEAHPFHKDSSILHNSFNVDYHIAFSHEVPSLSNKYGIDWCGSMLPTSTFDKKPHNDSSQSNVSTSTKELSLTRHYGRRSHDPMYSSHRQTLMQEAPLLKHEQHTLNEPLHDKGAKKAHSSSFFTRIKIKFCSMVRVRSRKVKMRKETNLKIQFNHKKNKNLRNHQGHDHIINNNTHRRKEKEHLKPPLIQRKGLSSKRPLRKVHNVPFPHAHHYIKQRAEVERLKKKTFLPYQAHLFSCLGFSF